jgi:hypothetical protein
VARPGGGKEMVSQRTDFVTAGAFAPTGTARAEGRPRGQRSLVVRERLSTARTGSSPA